MLKLDMHKTNAVEISSRVLHSNDSSELAEIGEVWEVIQHYFHVRMHSSCSTYIHICPLNSGNALEQVESGRKGFLYYDEVLGIQVIAQQLRPDFAQKNYRSRSAE